MTFLEYQPLDKLFFLMVKILSHQMFLDHKVSRVPKATKVIKGLLVMDLLFVEPITLVHNIM